MAACLSNPAACVTTQPGAWFTQPRACCLPVTVLSSIQLALLDLKAVLDDVTAKIQEKMAQQKMAQQGGQGAAAADGPLAGAGSQDAAPSDGLQ